MQSISGTSWTKQCQSPFGSPSVCSRGGLPTSLSCTSGLHPCWPWCSWSSESRRRRPDLLSRCSRLLQGCNRSPWVRLFTCRVLNTNGPYPERTSCYRYKPSCYPLGWKWFRSLTIGHRSSKRSCTSCSAGFPKEHRRAWSYRSCRHLGWWFVPSGLQAWKFWIW